MVYFFKYLYLKYRGSLFGVFSDVHAAFDVVNV